MPEPADARGGLGQGKHGVDHRPVERDDRQRREDPLEVPEEGIGQEGRWRVGADPEEVRDPDHDQRQRPVPRAVPERAERSERQKRDEERPPDRLQERRKLCHRWRGHEVALTKIAPARRVQLRGCPGLPIDDRVDRLRESADRVGDADDQADQQHRIPTRVATQSKLVRPAPIGGESR